MGDVINIAMKVGMIDVVIPEYEFGPNYEVFLTVLDAFNDEVSALILIEEYIAHEKVAEEVCLIRINPVDGQPGG